MKGNIIRITTQRLGGGSPLVRDFYVAIVDPGKSIEAVKVFTNASHDEKVEVVGALNDNTVAGLGLASGEVRQNI